MSFFVYCTVITTILWRKVSFSRISMLFDLSGPPFLLSYSMYIWNYLVQKKGCLIFLLVFILFFLLALKLVLNFTPSPKTFRKEFLNLGNSLPKLFCFDNILNKLLMLFWVIEPSQYLHKIINFLLLFSPSFIKSHLFPQVKQFSLWDELFPFNSFTQFVIVNIHQPKLSQLLMLRIIIIKLHFSQ